MKKIKEKKIIFILTKITLFVIIRRKNASSTSRSCSTRRQSWCSNVSFNRGRLAFFFVFHLLNYLSSLFFLRFFSSLSTILFMKDLQSAGINVSDIKKLQEAGLHTIGSVLQTCSRDLVSIKGLSDAKVEKV